MHAPVATGRGLLAQMYEVTNFRPATAKEASGSSSKELRTPGKPRAGWQARYRSW
jgi:hypothetical protein